MENHNPEQSNVPSAEQLSDEELLALQERYARKLGGRAMSDVQNTGTIIGQIRRLMGLPPKNEIRFLKNLTDSAERSRREELLVVRGVGRDVLACYSDLGIAMLEKELGLGTAKYEVTSRSPTSLT